MLKIPAFPKQMVSINMTEVNQNTLPTTLDCQQGDLALYGQLYLNRGVWNGQQIIPAAWIELSTKAHSVYNENYGIAYGMLWNVLMKTESRKSKSFFHTGVGIHMLGVYPASNVVLIHRVDTEKDYRFNQEDFYKMISLVWNAENK